MDLKLTYINDDFTEKELETLNNLGIRRPVLNTEYTLRGVIKNKEGHYCLLLNEITNRKYINGEPAFHYARFTDKKDNVLEWETVHKIYNQQIN